MINSFFVFLFWQHLQKASDEVSELYKKNKELEEKLSSSEREVITLQSDVTEWKEKHIDQQVWASI